MINIPFAATGATNRRMPLEPHYLLHHSILLHWYQGSVRPPSFPRPSQSPNLLPIFYRARTPALAVTVPQ